jgi:hypothetical protein
LGGGMVRVQSHQSAALRGQWVQGVAAWKLKTTVRNGTLGNVRGRHAVDVEFGFHGFTFLGRP